MSGPSLIMSSSDQQPKVTLENLLCLKRAERPAPEFWLTFERELRQKQLAALLEKRPWWQGLPQMLVRKAYLPIGATAILTFTLVSVKYYAPSQIAQSDEPVSSAPVIVAHPFASPSTATAALPVSSPLLNRVDQPAVNSAAEIRKDLNSNRGDSAAEKSLAKTDQIPAYSDPSGSPSARSIAANLAHLEQSEPELLNAVLGTSFGSQSRLQNQAAPVVELASLSSTSAKRIRLVAHYNDRQLSSEPTASEAARERLSRRLADADFNDRFSRIGLKGDQVSLKF
jgi:hypothetical protein